MKPGPGDSVKRGAVMEGVDRPRNLNGALAVTILFVLVMATVSCLNSSTGDREVRIGIVAYSDEEVERISTLNAAGMAAGEVNERGGVQAGGNSYRRYSGWCDMVIGKKTYLGTGRPQWTRPIYSNRGFYKSNTR